MKRVQLTKMKKIEKSLIKNLLGDDIFEVLQKSQILKIPTNSVVDIEDTKIGLQIVPRAILSFLFNRLKSMPSVGNDKIHLPFVENAFMEINKHGPDNYSGELIQDGKVISRFKYRTIPGIGLIIMSSFELYDMDILKEKEEVKEEEKEDYSKLQSIIDERIRLRELVEMVVNNKLSQREAMRNIIREKIHSFLTEKRYSDETPEPLTSEQEEMTESERYKEEMKRKISGMDKSSSISCQDCGTDIYKANDSKIECCICYGEFMGSNIDIKKTEHGYSLNFPKDFGAYNIKTLIKTIK